MKTTPTHAPASIATPPRTSALAAAFLSVAILLSTSAAAQVPPDPSPAGVTAVAPAPTEPALEPVPFGFDFVPMVGTSSAMAGGDLRHFSLNLLGGYAGAVKGAELAGLLNIERDFVVGAQLAGFQNVVFGDVVGAQLAGFGNVVGGDFRGAQLAGLGNVVMGDFEGVQIGGAFNYARRVTGVQIGVVNIAEKTDFSLGVVNVNWAGRTHIDMWAGDTGFLFTGVKHGGDHFHWIYGAGVRPGSEETELATVLGVGGHFPATERFFVDVDLLGQFIVNKDFDETSVGTLGTLRAVVGYRPTAWFAIYAGPTLNAYVSDDADGTRYALGGDSLVRDGGDGGTNVRVWPGFVLGVQFL